MSYCIITGLRDVSGGILNLILDSNMVFTKHHYMALYENDLIKVADELRLKGYSDEFSVKDDLIFSRNMNRTFPEENVMVEQGYQFDIIENAFDTQYLFAVYLPKYELRGLLIDLLGTYYFAEDLALSKRLRKVPLTTYLYDNEEPYIKYGLKKISPAEFDKNTNQYVLRIGYPDFPVCPIGIPFSMLGYDIQTQEYVWLSTHILKDNRLNKDQYETK